jgi:Fic family protein
VLYATPKATRSLETQLKELDELRRRLGEGIGARGPWLGQLRRQVRASAVESSVSIEGFKVPAGEAAALVAGDEPPPPDDQDRLAVSSYARAMDHVGIMATDPTFTWNERVILDLHFDACYFQRDKLPGSLRTGPIYVTSQDSGPPAYEGPPPEDVPHLLSETVGWLQSGDLDTHVAIRAAMAHLHLVSIHPFRDGNGRISRISQSLVLAREGLLSPEFNSIEEYLGHNTQKYYAVLRQVQAGSYQPDRDAGPWVRFCVSAHIEQAQQRLAQMAQAASRWTALEELVESRGWPDRLVIALEQSLFDGTERAAYANEAGISLATATSDLRRLLDAGFVTQMGRTRSTRYVASDHLRRETQEQDLSG